MKKKKLYKGFVDRGWYIVEVGVKHKVGVSSAYDNHYDNLNVNYFTQDIYSVCECTNNVICFVHKLLYWFTPSLANFSFSKYIPVFKYFNSTFKIGFCSCQSFNSLISGQHFCLSTFKEYETGCLIHKWPIILKSFLDQDRFCITNLKKYQELLGLNNENRL